MYIIPRYIGKLQIESFIRLIKPRDLRFFPFSNFQRLTEQIPDLPNNQSVFLPPTKPARYWIIAAVTAIILVLLSVCASCGAAAEGGAEYWKGLKVSGNLDPPTQSKTLLLTVPFQAPNDILTAMMIFGYFCNENMISPFLTEPVPLCNINPFNTPSVGLSNLQANRVECSFLSSVQPEDGALQWTFLGTQQMRGISQQMGPEKSNLSFEV